MERGGERGEWRMEERRWVIEDVIEGKEGVWEVVERQSGEGVTEVRGDDTLLPRTWEDWRDLP